MDTGRISGGAGGSPGGVSSGSDKGGIRCVFGIESYSASGLPKRPLTGQAERFFPSFFQRLTPRARLRAAALKRAAGTSSRALRAEHDSVHDPPRQQREQPGDDERARERKDHDAAMIRDAVAVRHPDPERKHRKREDRQQVDRAPRTEQPDLMDPERAEPPPGTQAPPDPPARAVR